MNFEIGYILSLIVIGLSFLGFTLAMMVDEVNRKKGVITFILSLILFGLGGYYYYLIGQWQKKEGGPSFNKLNYYLYIYRPVESEIEQKVPFIPPGPEEMVSPPESVSPETHFIPKEEQIPEKPIIPKKVPPSEHKK